MDSTILKKAAVLLRKQGKNVLAKSLEDQVEVMVKMEKATAPMPEIKMYFQDGRVFFQSPNPGFKKCKALSYQLRKLGPGYKYEKEGVWSFPSKPEIINKIKQVYADFFSDPPGEGARPAILINQEGKPCGLLPFSTYHKG